MTETEALAQAADKYRHEGYEVVTNPPPGELPEPLRRGYPSLVARRNGESVVLEVWSRNQVNDLPPDPLPAGWRFDVVLLPGADSAEIPGPGPAATPEFAERLLTELDELLPRGASVARLLLAWSTIESAMRVAAKREKLDADRMPPRQLLSELVGLGSLSHEQSDRLRSLLDARNRLAHGLPIAGVSNEDVAFLADLARSLLAIEPANAGA